MLEQKNSELNVLLVSMPFGSLLTPSIGLSLLKKALNSQKVSARILYFTFNFAQLIGTSSYNLILNGKPTTYDLVGEWLFSSILFGVDKINVEGYFENILRQKSPVYTNLNNKDKTSTEDFIRVVIDVQNKIELFLDQCLEQVINYHPKIVAFTSVFQQQLASLSLAKRIKAKFPEIFILLGGANCEGIMGAEIIRQFSFVDAVTSGEGDIIFPQLVKCLLEKKPFDNLQGVYTRQNIEQMWLKKEYLNASSVIDMDSLPIPDYDDFFEQLKLSNLKFNQNEKPRILMETSRGCWWGEKSHCNFCGLNGKNINFRSKSVQRVLYEIEILSEKYPNYPMSVVDNILDMNYFQNLIPELAKKQQKLDLFYEVKANLKKEQIRLLRDGGITTIQPGIESLSSHILKLMGKGVTSLQNIQLLKWCKEFGVTPLWNLLFGFPEEPPEEYQFMAKLIPLLIHLQPPKSIGNIRLDRFSPYFNNSEKYGLTRVKPYLSYYYIYPLEHQAITNLAYFFSFEYKQQQEVENYTKSVFEQVKIWKENHLISDLFSIDKGTHLLIWDFRPMANKPLKVLTGIKKILYLVCDSITTLHELENFIDKNTSLVIPRKELQNILSSLVNSGIMLQENNKYLSLAISSVNYSPNKVIWEQMQKISKTRFPLKR